MRRALIACLGIVLGAMVLGCSQGDGPIPAEAKAEPKSDSGDKVVGQNAGGQQQVGNVEKDAMPGGGPPKSGGN